MLRACAARLDGLPVDADPPPGPAAREQQPSAPWQGIAERALSKSLQALRVEAIHAVAALHAAHACGAELYRTRSVMWFAQLRGNSRCSPEARKLAELHGLWARDEVQLAQALRCVGEVSVPDALLADTLQLAEWEAELIEEVAGAYEVTIHRQLLAERER